MSNCESYGRNFEHDGSRHCYRCGKTWHQKGGKWPDQPLVCMEHKSEGQLVREEVKSLRAQLRESEEREKALMNGIRSILRTPISKIVREHLKALSDGGKRG